MKPTVRRCYLAAHDAPNTVCGRLVDRDKGTVRWSSPGGWNVNCPDCLDALAFVTGATDD